MSSSRQPRAVLAGPYTGDPRLSWALPATAAPDAGQLTGVRFAAENAALLVDAHVGVRGHSVPRPDRGGQSGDPAAGHPCAQVVSTR